MERSKWGSLEGKRDKELYSVVWTEDEVENPGLGVRKERTSFLPLKGSHTGTPNLQRKLGEMGNACLGHRGKKGIMEDEALSNRREMSN